jgi:hypothetical protein
MSREEMCSMLDGNAAGGLLREVFAFDGRTDHLRGLRQDDADGRAAPVRHRAGRHPTLPLMRRGGGTDRLHAAGTLARPAARGNHRHGVRGN